MVSSGLILHTMLGNAWKAARTYVASTICSFFTNCAVKLHIAQEYDDVQVLEHVQELLAEIAALNLPPRVDDDGEAGWVDEDEDDDGDVEMS